ncbi:MAG TPA: DUF3857 and transglutaminase domain-containing protein [Balneolales bacterium]|nr:DUF3857 and transglutaminase domain-containing protein [Balneolales bacterium]
MGSYFHNQIKFIGLLCLAFMLNGWGKNSLAQDRYPLPSPLPKVTYGVIPDTILKMQTYSNDPSADYIYVYKGVDIHFEVNANSISAIIKHHVRVKVFTKDGEKASLVDIPFYFKDNIERILSIRGITVHENGSRVKLDTTKIRTIGVNDRYKLKEFDMPAVKPGSVLDYTYTIKRRYIEELPDFYFMNTEPTLYARIRLINSKYIRYDATPVNMKNSPHYIQQKIDTSNVPKIFTVPQPPKVVIDNWYEFNVPALRKEPFITSLDDYRWKMKFIWSSFGNPRQVLGKSWAIVAAEVRKQNGLDDNIRKYPELEQKGKSIADSISDPKARLDSVFRYVNKAITYDGSPAVFSKQDLREVLKGQPANQSSINQALIAMLRGAGFEANPMLIATRKWGKVLNQFPSLYQFNGMIAYAKVDGKSYFMDATIKNSYPNMLPVKMINGSGFLIKKDSYKWIKLNPDKSHFSMKVKINAQMDTSGTLSGKMTSENYGYLAQKIRNQYNSSLNSFDIVHEDLFGRYNNPDFSHILFNNLNKLDKPVILSANFRIPNYAISYQSGLELEPLVIGYMMKNPLGDNNRNLPVTLQAPEHIEVDFQMELPKGYDLKQVQNDVSTAIPGARLAFKYDSGKHILKYHFIVSVNRKNFGQDLFPQLINLYEKWVDISKTKIFIDKD